MTRVEVIRFTGNSSKCDNLCNFRNVFFCCRCTLPHRFDSELHNPWMLMSKDAIPEINQNNTEGTEIGGNTNYNYDNPQDSEYCPQSDVIISLEWQLLFLIKLLASSLLQMMMTTKWVRSMWTILDLVKTA